MSRVTARRATMRIAAEAIVHRPDTLAVEEPLELRIDGRPLTVTMRTPGADIDLAHGFLLSENIIATAADIATARYCSGTDDKGRNTYNVLDIRLRAPAKITARSFLTTSACGLCGKTALEEINVRTRHPLPDEWRPLAASLLADLPDRLRAQQRVFDVTGGLHAAGLFSYEGSCLAVREDVGRHNAVDKVIGWALRENLIPSPDLVLIVSGRASFELVQKAVMAGIPILGAVSAPSSLAVDLAVASGMTLAGFIRGGKMNIYSGSRRIVPSATSGRPETT
ncbi:formate dehydrogenase accessory sulfurtransferase FdhD [Nocardia sp. NPDC055029]